MQTPTRVASTLELELTGLDGLSVAIPAVLTYDRVHPLTITAAFDVGREQPVHWVFSRELLADGLCDVAGEGDITVWTERDDSGDATLWMCLVSPTGVAIMQANAGVFTDFLAATFDIVAMGEESALLDIDSMIDGLLGR